VHRHPKTVRRWCVERNFGVRVGGRWSFDGDAYRAVYTVKFAGVVYVLHAFQKKSKRGRATPQHNIDLINSRLKLAEEHYRENYQKKAG
jgi:phage-related protein